MDFETFKKKMDDYFVSLISEDAAELFISIGFALEPLSEEDIINS